MSIDFRAGKIERKVVYRIDILFLLCLWGWKTPWKSCLMTLKWDPKRNMHLLCDTIDFKESVEGTPKVQGKIFGNCLG